MPMLEKIWYVETPGTRDDEEGARTFFDIGVRPNRYFFDNEVDAVAFLVSQVKDHGVENISLSTTEGSKLDVRV